MIEDKTVLGDNENTRTPSKAFREYIESLVEEVVLNKSVFNNHKKYLQLYSQEEGLDYATLEKSLTDFFMTMKDWKSMQLLSNKFAVAARTLAKECYIDENEMEQLFSASIKTNIQALNGHEYVDLDLPSGNLWATCNIGATKPEDFGVFFAWGETQPKTDYCWNTYKHRIGLAIQKYRKNDENSTLQPCDDAATANWGLDWHIPTLEDWLELQKYTTQIGVTRIGIEGQLFTAQNGDRIFLPAAPFCGGDSNLRPKSGSGYYWSSSLKRDKPDLASILTFSKSVNTIDVCRRHLGLSVRPVHPKVK